MELTNNFLEEPELLAKKRLTSLFDSDSFTELGELIKTCEKPSGVVTGYGYINGNPAYAYSQDSTVDGGAVGVAQTLKIKKIYEMAAKTGAPVIGIFDSNGVRIEEGCAVLNGYSEILMAANNVSGVVPQISLILGICAGISSMIACSSDFILMSEKSELFLTPPFLTETNPETSGNNKAKVGSSIASSQNGLACMVLKDDESVINNARKLISMLPANNISPLPASEYIGGNTGISVNKDDNALNTVKSISDADTVLELYNGYGMSVVTAFVKINGNTAAVVATEKDRTIDRDASCKAAHFIRICDAFNIPVITLLGTPGFEKSLEGEIGGNVRDAAKLAHCYAEATCPKICVITGEAYGATYAVMAGKNAGADIVIAWDSAVISPLSPVASVEILWRDKIDGAEDINGMRNQLISEYKNTKASPFEAAAMGYVDIVIKPEETREKLISSLEILGGKRMSRLPKKHGNMPV